MKSQIARFLIAGMGTVGLYVGGVWFGTDILNLPARGVNAVFYVLATAISFALNYRWVFTSNAKAGSALFRYLLLQAFGIILNFSWVEAGLRFTQLYPWIIAASYFVIWPFLSFNIQKRVIFNR